MDFSGIVTTKHLLLDTLPIRLCGLLGFVIPVLVVVRTPQLIRQILLPDPVTGVIVRVLVAEPTPEFPGVFIVRILDVAWDVPQFAHADVVKRRIDGVYCRV